MTIAYLAKPGSEFGPCAGETCKHPEHQSTRQKAKAICPKCEKPIGYSVGFHEQEDGTLIHHTCAVKAGAAPAGPLPQGEATSMTTKTTGAKKAPAAKKAAPKKEKAPKSVVQYWRNGEPITNPSVNSLSGVAYFYTKGVDGDRPRITTDELIALLKKAGVEVPVTKPFEVTLPGPKATVIKATIGKLEEHKPRVKKSETPAAKAAAAATKKSATNVRTAKAETEALQAWEDGGKKGPRPATPQLDGMKDKLSKRTPAAKPAAKKAPAKKAAAPAKKAPAAAKVAPSTGVKPKPFTGPLPKTGTKTK